MSVWGLPGDFCFLWHVIFPFPILFLEMSIGDVSHRQFLHWSWQHLCNSRYCKLSIICIEWFQPVCLRWNSGLQSYSVFFSTAWQPCCSWLTVFYADHSLYLHTPFAQINGGSFIFAIIRPLFNCDPTLYPNDTPSLCGFYVYDCLWVVAISQDVKQRIFG